MIHPVILKGLSVPVPGARLLFACFPKEEGKSEVYCMTPWLLVWDKQSEVQCQLEGIQAEVRVGGGKDLEIPGNKVLASRQFEPVFL